MRNLLTVENAVEVIDAWSKWRGGREPTRAERCAAVVYYAEHDAYMPLELAP